MLVLAGGHNLLERVSSAPRRAGWRRMMGKTGGSVRRRLLRIAGSDRTRTVPLYDVYGTVKRERIVGDRVARSA